MIRLFVIEDHAVTVAGIRNFFRASREGIVVTGCTTRVEDALEQADLQQTDLFLLDLWIHSSNPLENLRLLREKFPDKPVVVFTSEVSPLWQQKMMEAGAMGYLVKTATRQEIKEALERVMSGHAVFSVALETFDKDKRHASSSRGVNPSLTEHQQRLLVLIIRGLPQHEIAATLGVTISTVEKSLKALRVKFEVGTNAELIRLVTANRLV